MLHDRDPLLGPAFDGQALCHTSERGAWGGTDGGGGGGEEMRFCLVGLLAQACVLGRRHRS